MMGRIRLRRNMSFWRSDIRAAVGGLGSPGSDPTASQEGRCNAPHQRLVYPSADDGQSGPDRLSGMAIGSCLWELACLTILCVKLSVKTDYATRAVLGLARHFPTGKAMKVEELAAGSGTPANYLVQILIELKSQQIVRSVRGKEGGYLLARPPVEITLGDVLRCVHGQVFESPAQQDNQCPAELRTAWEQLQSALDTASDAITFQKLLDDATDKGKMYYI